MTFDRGEIINRWSTTKPQVYLDDDAERRAFIAERIIKYVPIDATILEIGCNAGSNLAALQRRGFTKLYGIDINNHAIAAAKKRVSFTAFRGDLSEIFETMEAAGPYDVVFTVAVLMHLHPDDEPIIKRIPELVKKYLIVCEWEQPGNNYIFQRNYKELFQLPQIHEESITNIKYINGYQLRIFRREEK